MPFERPTLNELKERIRADIRVRLPDAKPELRRSLEGVLADIESGAVHGLYGYLDWLARQLMMDTAEAEQLERWAGIWGITRSPATAAAGDVVFTGTNGATIPAGTAVQASDGTQYTTDAVGTIDAGTATVAMTASETGVEGNQDAGTELTLVSPVTGIDSTATVDAGGLTGGADLETDSRLRERLLLRVRRPPHGGAKADYKQWALEAHPDVTRAFVYPHELGIGTVTVRIMTDDLVDPIPTQAVIDAVQAYIDERRPVTAEVHVVAPVAVALDFTISITPDTAEVRDRIEEALKDHLRLKAEPGGTLYLSQLNGAIFVAAGESPHDLQAPIADQVYNTGEIAVMGAITWV